MWGKWGKSREEKERKGERCRLEVTQAEKKSKQEDTREKHPKLTDVFTEVNTM